MNKNLFDRFTEEIGYRECQFKRWVILAVFNRADRLSGNTNCLGKFLLIQAALFAQLFYTVFQIITPGSFMTSFLYIFKISHALIYVKVPLHLAIRKHQMFKTPKGDYVLFCAYAILQSCTHRIIL